MMSVLPKRVKKWEESKCQQSQIHIYERVIPFIFRDGPKMQPGWGMVGER